MNAAVCVEPGNIQIKEVPVKPVGPNEVLVKVAYCGICPSDLRTYRGLSSRKLPTILGHEFTGWVEGVGDSVRDIKVGERVAVDPGRRCYTKCNACRHGYTNKCSAIAGADDGFAEYHVTDARNVYPLKDSTSMVAASLCEPLACVLHGQDQARIKPGSTVVVTGCGPIGLLHIRAANHAGAKVIASDISPERLEKAREFGAALAVDPSKTDLRQTVLAETDGWGADSAIVAIGKSEVVEQALELLAIRGTLVIFAGIYPDTPVSISPNFVHYSEVNITGSSDYTDYDFARALRFIESGTIDTLSLVSDIVPFNEINEGMRLVASGKGLKVVVQIGA